MFSSDDTIVAIATPAGRGGIGIVRVSGPRAADVAAQIITRRQPLQPRLAIRTKVRLESRSSAGGDHVVVTWFEAPHSYTGEHVVEISAHGSPVVLGKIVSRAVAAGARLARPGEFTFRAFLHGRLDLVQAEAVGDLIAAATPLQARVAFDQLEGTLSTRLAAVDQVLLDLVARLEASLDFPDEGFHFIDPGTTGDAIGSALRQIDDVLSDAARGRMIREGATVAIVGRTNVGKSSLFNALVGQQRAIVTDVPGTTRDFLTEKIEIEGLAITLVDTAGERDGGDVVEREGVERARRVRESADLAVIVIDSGEPLSIEDRRLLDDASTMRGVIVASKADRAPQWQLADALPVSVVTDVGLSELRRAIAGALSKEEMLRDTAAISNLRHITLLTEARAALDRARAMAAESAPEEFVLGELHQARTSFAEIAGAGARDEVLDHIFQRFCVGK